MNVLIACEESQRVCTAFRERGQNAFSCDILPCSGGHPEWHIQGDVLEVLNPDIQTLHLMQYYGIYFHTMDGLSHIIKGTWDLIIAHPPCTKISNAGARWLYPQKGRMDVKRYSEGLRAKKFMLGFLEADCPRIVVENPKHSRIFDIPEPTQWIQPYEFGDPYTKLTGLWIKGDLKPLVPDNTVEPIGPYCPSGTGRKKKDSYGAAKRGNDSVERSKTFPGIARAMAEQWG